MPKIFEGDEPFYVYVPSFEEYLAEKFIVQEFFISGMVVMDMFK